MKNKTTILFILLAGPFFSTWGEVAFEMIPFETGTFSMGSPQEEKGRDSDEEGADEIRVEVTIGRSFEIGKYEVTQRQWFAVMDENPSFFKKSKYCNNYIELNNSKGVRVGMCPNHPVERVSWRDTKEFFHRLNGSYGNTGCGGNPRAEGCWRLPTEAEWEYAARAGTTTSYSFVDDREDLGEYGWYSWNSNFQTHEVGMRKANPRGLHDVHGNVWEWTMDKYAKKLLGGKDPLQESGTSPVIRGGGWDSIKHDLRSADRNSFWDFRYSNVGFRAVRTLAHQ